MQTLHAATEQAKRFNTELSALQDRWRQALGHPRADSAAERLVQRLPHHPVLNGE
jgi:hypothetical protein